MWMCIPVFLIERRVRVDTTWSIQVVSSLSLSSTDGSCWGSKEQEMQSKHARLKHGCWFIPAGPKDKDPHQFYFKMTYFKKIKVLNHDQMCCSIPNSLLLVFVVKSWLHQTLRETNVLVHTHLRGRDNSSLPENFSSPTKFTEQQLQQAPVTQHLR